MKYIMLFERLKGSPIFKSGDYVKYKFLDDNIYKVDDVEPSKTHRYIYWLDSIDHTILSKGWVSEDEIFLIPDFELAAMKYNL